MEIRDTRYAKTDDDVYLAYQVTGTGPVDVVWYFDSLGNVDVVWERPEWQFWFESLSSFCRLILLDRRGTGLSSRNVPPPNLETQIHDLKVVLDRLGSSQTVLGGNASSGAVNAMFAATFPDRVQSLVWYAPSARAAWAPDYPWGVGPQYFAREQHALERWGTIEYAAGFKEQEEVVGHILEDAAALVVAKQSRHIATPDVAREQTRIWYETDVRAILPSVTAPALLLAYDAHTDDVEQNSIPSLRRSCSRISSIRPRGWPHSAIEAGNTSSSVTTRSFGTLSRSGVEPRRTRRGTASMRPSTARRGRSDVRSRSWSASET